MSHTSFEKFFHTATGKEPYAYQRRLANATADDATGTDCSSQLISIPTGLGKTAAVVLAWLWNRVILKNENWPRRLVYCLPMRTLVEQTRDEAGRWIENLLGAASAEKIPLSPATIEQLQWLKKHSPVILMGGEENDASRRDWDIHPERPAILIGTQDMLLSRALNRGYGMARARWPMHFGLLNNDALWILDETQLMGAGLWTSAQLDWLRQDRFKPAKSCATWWMSATVGTTFLKTKDRKDARLPEPAKIEINDDETTKLDILKAVRPVSNWQPAQARERKDCAAFLDALAADIRDKHAANSLSLVVCNSVKAAQELHRRLKDGGGVLLTSRFRLADRKAHLDKLLAFETVRKAHARDSTKPAPEGLICVSTQVVEAGVDISACRLWTELAPWPSMLQRLGRLNRDAKLNETAKAFVFELPPERAARSKTTTGGPYDETDIKDARKIIGALVAKCEAAPTKPIRPILAELSADNATGELIKESLEPKPVPFPRAFDVHGLFSTEPDAFGGFTDVSTWVRSGDKNADVTVFWRDWDTKKSLSLNPLKGTNFIGPAFHREEACAVAVHRVRAFAESVRSAHIWDDKAEKWKFIRPAEIVPGMVVLFPASAGGYSGALGWTGDKSDKLAGLPPPGPFEESDDADPDTQIGHWVTIDTHLDDTAKIAGEIAEWLQLPSPFRECLIQSARLHDIGKSLAQWQNKLPEPRPAAAALYAKAPWELVLDLSQKPDATKECLELIQGMSEQKIIFQREADSDANGAGTRLHLQLRKKPEDATLEKLKDILQVKKTPALTAFRPGCRHEAASALAMWDRYYHGDAQDDFPALSIYLVAAHHGKVRTVLRSRSRAPAPNICGIPSNAPQTLQWDSGWKLDFEAAIDGASGQFHEDGTFSVAAPGWTGLVADLLGAWEKDAPKLTCKAVPEKEPHALGPFALAYWETLLRAADGRASANPSQEITHPGHD
jgi:CRISPR-associated endonuclease/helicase Cas3